MIFIKFLFGVTFVVINLWETDAHGMLMDPVNRGSAWRKGFGTPPNYDDSGNYCGGYTAHALINGGKCGACGDNYSHKQPRANENGGKYGTGTIVKTYTAGQKFVAKVELTVNHWGYFEFNLCPLNGPDDLETEECFDKYPVKLADGSSRYNLKSRASGNYDIELVLPENVSCKHCALRWHYKVANSWGKCEDGHSAPGCGFQETFRTCSDISIAAA